jgi:hypothetical protein
MPPCLPVTRRRLLAWPLVMVVAGAPALASPQAIELQALRLQRADGVLSLDFAARIQLSRTVEEALQRGVPVYFTAQAQLLRNRWYWRDERVARVQRRRPHHLRAAARRPWRTPLQPTLDIPTASTTARTG